MNDRQENYSKSLDYAQSEIDDIVVALEESLMVWLYDFLEIHTQIDALLEIYWMMRDLGGIEGIVQDIHVQLRCFEVCFEHSAGFASERVADSEPRELKCDDARHRMRTSLICKQFKSSISTQWFCQKNGFVKKMV